MEIDILAIILYIFLLTCISGIWCGSINRCIRSRYCIGEIDVEDPVEQNENNSYAVVESPDAMIYINNYISQLNIEQRIHIMKSIEDNRINGITVYQYYHLLSCILQIYFEDEIIVKLSYLSDENEFCTICQSDIDDKQKCSKFPCGHFFHEECIFNWFQHSGKCPLCMNTIYHW